MPSFPAVFGNRRIAPLAVGASALALVAGSGLLAEPASAGTETPAVLYVGQTPTCSDRGPGTDPAAPFCSIVSAAAVVEPGQTVRIADGQYPGIVRITRSGTPDKPIRFEGYGYGTALNARSVIDGTQGKAAGLVIDGAHDIVISRLGTAEAGIRVDNAQRITLDGLRANSATNTPIGIGGTSSEVTLSRTMVWIQAANADAVGVRVESGAAGTVVTGNLFRTESGDGVRVVDAPGTVVTGNSFLQVCTPGLRISGPAEGTSVQNNVFGRVRTTTCTAAPHPGFLNVSAASVAGLTVDYNLLYNGPTFVPYVWGETPFTEATDFRTASGQGAHDITSTTVDRTERSPLIDSANVNAPGHLDTDFLGNARIDDPLVADTGTGIGYADRGALEFTNPLKVSATAAPNPPTVRLPVTVTATPTATWSDKVTYTFDFGDGTPPVTGSAASVQHVYLAAESFRITVKATDDLGGNATAETFIRPVQRRVPCAQLPAGCAWNPNTAPVTRG